MVIDAREAWHIRGARCARPALIDDLDACAGRVFQQPSQRRADRPSL